jgi:hypothetical protein
MARCGKRHLQHRERPHAATDIGDIRTDLTARVLHDYLRSRS